MVVRHLGCTDSELDLLTTHRAFVRDRFEPIDLPISGTREPIEILVAGSLTDDMLNLAATVSDWNWPPVTICLFPETAADREIENLPLHPRIGRSIFACRNTGEAVDATLAAAGAFLKARAAAEFEDILGIPYTINNISPRWLFESMMETLDEYIYFKDDQSRFLAVSRYLVEQCGRAHPSEILGQTDFQFFDKRHAREAYADERKIAAGELPELHKEESLDKDDKRHWVLSRKFPLRTRSNYLAGSFGISRDITEAKELQQAIEQSNRRMQDELRLAKNLQRTLMGQRMPRFEAGPGGEPLQIAARYVPSFHLSGDFYSCRRTPSGAAAFLVADVVGHGVRAAMITAMIQIAVQQLDAHTDEPATFMSELNRIIHESVKPIDDTIFATAVFARLDLATSRLEFVQAGARHGASISRGDAKLFSCGGIGPALGLLPDSAYEATSVAVDSGDEFVLYTDGLIEASRGDEVFGEERLLKMLSIEAGTPWDPRFDRLLASMREFTGRGEMEDDVCLLAVRMP